MAVSFLSKRILSTSRAHPSKSSFEPSVEWLSRLDLLEIDSVSLFVGAGLGTWRASGVGGAGVAALFVLGFAFDAS